MKLKKITAIITLIASIAPYSLTFAEKGELPDVYMEDIFRFDLNEEFMQGEEVESAEILGNAENLAVALGYMSLSGEGKFRGEEYLSADEFEESILKLFGTAYRDEISDKAVTYGIALEGLIDFLGYSASIDQGGKSVKDVAYELGLLAEDVSIDKFITRKAFAEILTKVYDIPIYRVDYVSSSEYSFVEGETVLEEQNIHKIKGYVNAVWGIDVFSVSAPEEDVIEINSTEYMAGDMEVSGYLGMNVESYVLYDEDSEEWKLLYIEQSKNCDRIYEELKSISKITESRITYEKDEKSRYADISGLENIIINGEHKRDISTLYNIDFETAEGYFSLSKSNDGKFNTLIVWNFESFTSASVNTEKKDIYLKYGATYDGLSYIDIPEENEDAYAGVFVDGKKGRLEDITENMAVSVVQSEDKMYTVIYASKAVAEGKITAIDENMISLDAESYIISDDYYKAADTENLKINSTGIFYITHFSTLAGCDITADSDILYGYLRKAIFDTDSGEEQIMLKIFTSKGEWQRYICAEKITLDGKKVKANESYSLITPGENELIRYKLNDDGKITFLDTITQADAEKDDDKKLNKVLNGHSTVFFWTLGSYLRNTPYKFKNSSTIFMFPDDRSLEERYSVMSMGSFKTSGNTTYTLDLYTPDEYLYCDAVVCRETSTTTERMLFVTDIYDTVDKDDMPVLAVKGYRMGFEASGNVEYLLDEEVQKKIADKGIEFKKNSIAWISIANDEIKDCTEILDVNEDYKYESDDRMNVIGEVLKVERSLKYIMVDVNGEKITKESNGAPFIYVKDLSNPKSALTAATMDDVQPGDRIILQGGWGLYYSVIILKK